MAGAGHGLRQNCEGGEARRVVFFGWEMEDVKTSDGA